VTHVYSPAVTLLKHTGLDSLLIRLGFHNFFVIPNPISIVLREVLNKFRRTFWRLLEMACGMSKTIHTNMEMMPTIIRNEPGGTSTYNGKHWLDNIRKGGFYRFDYGNDQENLKKYGSTTVPTFNV
jgi:pimeloyl-ACP methyl ester carboxylesterase